jgi:hypothetical protein
MIVRDLCGVGQRLHAGKELYARDDPARSVPVARFDTALSDGIKQTLGWRLSFPASQTQLQNAFPIIEE